MTKPLIFWQWYNLKIRIVPLPRILGNKIMNPLPRKGDQIEFIGGKLFAFHTNCVENAKKLTPGELYTVTTMSFYSSWSKVTVKELPTQGKVGDDWLSLAFFRWPRCQVLKGQDQKHQCENPAEYSYIPAKEGETSEFCADCLFELSNGQPCSCEINYISGIPGVSLQTELETGEIYDIGEFPPENIAHLENIRWKWLDKGQSWYYIDSKGRPFPCCEYLPTDYLAAKGSEFIDSILN